MKSWIIAIMLVCILNHLSAQEQFVKIKTKIYREIIRSLKPSGKEYRMWVFANMHFRAIQISRGVGGRHVSVTNENANDSATFKNLSNSLNNEIKNKILVLKTFNNVGYDSRLNFFGNLISTDTVSEKYSKTYVEIDSPIDNWDVLPLFKLEKEGTYEGGFMRFHIPEICIPVFVYYVGDSVRPTSLLLFRFKLVYSNNTISAKLADKKPL